MTGNLFWKRERRSRTPVAAPATEFEPRALETAGDSRLALGTSLRTRGPALDPNFHLCGGLDARERRQTAAVAGIPAPADKIVVGHMIEKLSQGAPAVLFGIFELPAKIARRTADKHHLLLRKRQRPLGIARRHVIARKILYLMAGIATHGDRTMP